MRKLVRTQRSRAAGREGTGIQLSVGLSDSIALAMQLLQG
jgi:hypothetical protein